MSIQNILLSLLLTTLGGLTTVIGGFIAVSGKYPRKKLLSLSMGFAAGIMLFVSFTEMLSEGREYLEQVFEGGHSVDLAVFLSFFGGIAIIAIIDALLPDEASHHTHVHECGGHHNTSLYRTGLITMAAIGLHNFPEGLATFSATAVNLSLGLPLIVAVTLHNIPIGFSIAMPIYVSTGNKKKAVFISLLAGLITLVGAVTGALLFQGEINAMLLGVVFAAIAGIMVFVALKELYPAARENGNERSAIYSLIAGMAFMAGAMLIM